MDSSSCAVVAWPVPLALLAFARPDRRRIRRKPGCRLGAVAWLSSRSSSAGAARADGDDASPRPPPRRSAEPRRPPRADRHDDHGAEGLGPIPDTCGSTQGDSDPTVAGGLSTLSAGGTRSTSCSTRCRSRRRIGSADTTASCSTREPTTTVTGAYLRRGAHRARRCARRRSTRRAAGPGAANGARSTTGPPRRPRPARGRPPRGPAGGMGVGRGHGPRLGATPFANDLGDPRHAGRRVMAAIERGQVAIRIPPPGSRSTRRAWCFYDHRLAGR